MGQQHGYVLRDQQQFCQYIDLTKIASFSIKQLF